MRDVAELLEVGAQGKTLRRLPPHADADHRSSAGFAGVDKGGAAPLYASVIGGGERQAQLAVEVERGTQRPRSDAGDREGCGLEFVRLRSSRFDFVGSQVVVADLDADVSAEHVAAVDFQAGGRLVTAGVDEECVGEISRVLGRSGHETGPDVAAPPLGKGRGRQEHAREHYKQYSDFFHLGLPYKPPGSYVRTEIFVK